MKNWTGENCNRLKRIIERISIEDGKYICRIIYKDPFTDIYSILLIIYVFILGGFLLWPFDFIFKVKNDVCWIGNSKGIEFLKIGQAVSNSSTQEFFDSLVKGNGLTLEMWTQTENLDQIGPAKIISYSIDPPLCNFTVGQWRDKLVVQLRTTKTNLYGRNPHLDIPDVFTSQGLKHMVIMYNLSEQKVYINGVQKVRSDILKGDFSNWDPSCKLVIGNEVSSNKPWIGKIYYAAIFNRPLADQEIRQNYLSGPQHTRNKRNIKHSYFKAKGPVAKYFFDEDKGSVIHDSGSLSIPVNLSLPKYIGHKIKPFLSVSIDYLQNDSRYSDIIINILIFILLGILIQGVLRTRYGLTLKISLATLLAGTLFSLGVESLQHFSMTRNSSLIDVATNMTGVAIGIVMDRFYNIFLNYKAKHLWTQMNTDY